MRPGARLPLSGSAGSGSHWLCGCELGHNGGSIPMGSEFPHQPQQGRGVGSWGYILRPWDHQNLGDQASYELRPCLQDDQNLHILQSTIFATQWEKTENLVWKMHVYPKPSEVIVTWVGLLLINLLVLVLPASPGTWSPEAGCSNSNIPVSPATSSSPGQAQCKPLTVFLRHTFHQPPRANSTLIAAFQGPVVKWEGRLISIDVDFTHIIIVPFRTPSQPRHSFSSFL